VATVIFIFTAVFLTTAAVISGFPGTLMLERAFFPLNHGIKLNQLKARDKLRNHSILQYSNGVVDFHVNGTIHPFQDGNSIPFQFQFFQLFPFWVLLFLFWVSCV
jgi:hypothetical protein